MNIKKYKFLNIKGTVLDNYQLQNYMEKIAISHDIQQKSDKNTYPIPRLKENFKFIEKTYKLLNEHIKLKIDVHPAGEWILDNFYIIEETFKTICLEMNLKKYKDFPGIQNGMYKGFARIYALASEIVAYTDNKINDEIIELTISSYQKRKLLSMEEIWNLWIFLEIAIIENIRNICEKIYLAQIQKYKVENIIERLVEKKESKSQVFKNVKKEANVKDTYKKMKFPFIEYMSYKLKKYGKKSIPYLEVLENEVNKMGTTISDVIKREHYDVAISKVSIGNSIISLKEILRVNFLNIFEEINGVEEILKKDPSNVYCKMDYKTKDMYRNEIKEISKITKISEIYIANKLIELAKKHTEKESKKTHIGYYLISNGREELFNELGFKEKVNQKNSTKVRKYILVLYICTTVISILTGIYLYLSFKKILISILFTLLLYIPISEIIIQTTNYILNKRVKPKVLPKLDFSKELPQEYSTFVVIPTIINSKEKVKELIKKLEVYYLANKANNLYFALLGDCTSCESKNEKNDNDIINTGLLEIEKLNTKYNQDINEFPKFHFLYRERTWNEGEKCYLGWERKRGLLCQFNEFLVDKTNKFKVNTILNESEKSGKEYPKIKYVITLDSDTKLVLETALKLIGTMAHILNKPVLNQKCDLVIDGYGLIQPRIGVNLEASRKSLFTKIFAGDGGVDSYSNAISDVYQDNFDEGIFTGKGIYDVKIFHKILCNEIPENTVLSHDLLEGCYLRCGLATDVLLLDDCPSKYNTFILRQSRWIRGDFQISRWLRHQIKIKNENKKVNPLNILSRFKIFDNLRRSLVPVFIGLSIILAIILKKYINIWEVIAISLIAYVFPTILDILNHIIFKKGKDARFIYAHKSFRPSINAIKASIIRGTLDIIFLPHKVYITLSSIIKALYRMNVSKKHLLEWLTAEEAEKQAKTDLVSYYRFMLVNVITGIIALMIGIFSKGILEITLGLIWIIGPSIACYISKDIKKILPLEEISNIDKEYLIEIGKRTWQYFKDTINEENNFLPPDNYQEGRINKIARKNIYNKYWTRHACCDFSI